MELDQGTASTSPVKPAQQQGDDASGNETALDGALEVKAPAVFERTPSEMIRLFSVSIETDAPIGLRTSDLIAEQAAMRAVALREDPDSAARFLQVLTDVRETTGPAARILLRADRAQIVADGEDVALVTAAVVDVGSRMVLTLA